MTFSPTFTPDIEITADRLAEQAKIKAAIALVPDLEWAGLSFEDAVGIKKMKLDQQIAELQKQRALLDLL